MDDKIDRRREVEIALDFPVQLADRKLEKVTIRRPVMRDFLKHKIDLDMNIEDAVKLLSDLCGIVPDELEMLDVCDFEKLQVQLLRFRGIDLSR